jgi:hypothetical protein
MIATNPKNQGKLNKAIDWLKKYNSFNELRDIADGNGDEKEWNKYQRFCERSFDKYLEYCAELPKGQVTLIEKSELY